MSYSINYDLKQIIFNNFVLKTQNSLILRYLNNLTYFSPPKGKVSGYKSGWKPNRPFAIDMAGFAINLELILTKTEAAFSYKMIKGLQESEFLSYFTSMAELEPLADKCTKVYVWHTRTEKPVVTGFVEGYEV